VLGHLDHRFRAATQDQKHHEAAEKLFTRQVLWLFIEVLFYLEEKRTLENAWNSTR